MAVRIEPSRTGAASQGIRIGESRMAGIEAHAKMGKEGRRQRYPNGFTGPCQPMLLTDLAGAK
jgi:hypothetical protein